MSGACLEIGKNAPPVCLFAENPNKLVSLLDLVNEFNAVALVGIIGNFSFFTCAFGGTAVEADSDWPAIREEFFKEIESGIAACKEAHLDDAVAMFKRIRGHVLSEPNNLGVFCSESKHATSAIEHELEKRKFLYILPERVEYVDNDQLFGKEVQDAFPSAARDIKEAGNCLAVECGTGSRERITLSNALNQHVYAKTCLRAIHRISKAGTSTREEFPASRCRVTVQAITAVCSLNILCRL